MKYKGILLDIDNTLYEYDKAHLKALNKLILYCSDKFHFSKENILYAYNNAKKKVHIELSETASSHNRILYIQKMLEILDVNSTKYSLDIYEVYWNTFLENIEVYAGVYEFLEKYRNKICLITDLTAHIQHRKIKRLKIDDYVGFAVTSEEAGKEKPHPYIFMMGLGKLNLKAEDVCMVGDSFKKDIIGASNIGIKSIWLNRTQEVELYDKNMVTEVKTFEEILELV
jgi:HAD superfamily hydrolase (TIGR01549 family)